MDVTNGDLLGCASGPSYGPDLFVRGITGRDYGALRDSEFRTLSDKLMQGAYPPGSTINMSNALAAEETGLMDREETVACKGFTLASPIQRATMTARLASGTAVLPRLVRPLGGPTPTAAFPAALGLSAEALTIVRQGMFELSNHERGTAYGSRIADATKAMTGKTGTSQVFPVTAAERAVGVRSQDERPWTRRDHHRLFVAFAPHDAPRFAVTVMVENGGGGSTAAASIARDIMLFAQHGGLPPEDACPTSPRAREREYLALLSGRILPSDGATATVSRA